MADKVTVKAEKREKSGKGYARRLRQQARIPINIYGDGIENVSAAVDLKDLAAILRTEAGSNTVFSLDVAGVGASDVMFQDRQIDPLTGRLLHADLRRLKKGEKIEVTVPLHFIGEPIGVRENDGVLQQQMREIKILCEPANIPDFFEVEVENLELNESVHVSDIKPPAGVEIHEDPEAVVASVTLVKEEVEEPQLPEEGAEPEIVGEEKTDEEGGEQEKK